MHIMYDINLNNIIIGKKIVGIKNKRATNLIKGLITKDIPFTCIPNGHTISINILDIVNQDDIEKIIEDI